jgi:hypothetical protein
MSRKKTPHVFHFNRKKGHKKARLPGGLGKTPSKEKKEKRLWGMRTNRIIH